MNQILTLGRESQDGGGEDLREHDNECRFRKESRVVAGAWTQRARGEEEDREGETKRDKGKERNGRVRQPSR